LSKKRSAPSRSTSACGRYSLSGPNASRRASSSRFSPYGLSIALRQQLRAHAGGLMPRAVLEKFVTEKMLDVAAPTTGVRELLLDRLGPTLPPQPSPRIRAPQAL
jgi:hypothetical protein